MTVTAAGFSPTGRTRQDTGSRGARIHRNGSGVPRATWLGATTVGGGALFKCAAGDQLALHGFQNPGSTITTLGGSGYATDLTAERLPS